VLVTHDQEEALGIADLVAVLRDGRTVQADPPQRLYAEPADLGVATFVGDAVLLEATATGRHARTVLGDLELSGPADGTGTVLLRPEQLLLGDSAVDNGAPVVTVQDTMFHGHDATVLLELNGHALRARVQGGLTVAPGQRVSVHVTGTGRFYPATRDAVPEVT
jgi:iron(III) transport system ATP-binding protein